MLNLFSKRLNNQRLLGEVDDLKKRIDELEEENQKLVSALRKTQDVVAAVSKAQSEFIVEFNRVLLPVLDAARESHQVFFQDEDWN